MIFSRIEISFGLFSPPNSFKVFDLSKLSKHIFLEVLQVQGLWKEKVHYLCLVYTLLMEKHWTFLLHIKIAYDLRVCHDFDPRSFWQVQGHWKKKVQKFVSGLYLSYGETLDVPTLHKDSL